MAKGTSRDEVTLISGKIKPVAIVVMELCLSEGFKVRSQHSAIHNYHIVVIPVCDCLIALFKTAVICFVNANKNKIIFLKNCASTKASSIRIFFFV